MKIKALNEIIDANGELIGANDIPTSGPNLDSAANNTTDYNMKVGTQPYRFDFMGRMGFGLQPFYENDNSKDGDNQDDNELLKDIAKLMYDKYMEVLKHYYKHPNQLKSDYRVKSEQTFETQETKYKNVDFNLAKKVLKIVDQHLSSKDEKKNIDEGVVVEDKMMEKKSEEEMSKKTESNDIKDKKLVKIAGLISKMPDKDVDKLMTLLEKKK